MKTTVTIETIKPAEATTLLANLFEGQRHMRERHWQRLAQEIREKRFLLSPDALVICKGKLANGQHRMKAVEESGIAAQFLVMRTDDDDLYKIIDAGIKRTESDVLGRIQYSKQIAAITKLVVDYDKGVITPMGRKFDAVVTRMEIIDYAERNTDALAEAIAITAPLYSSKPIVPSSLTAALFHLGARKNRAKTEAFVRAVYEGTSRDDSAFDVRERLIRNSSSKARLPRSYIFGLLVKALKYYLNDTRPGVLKISEGEEFPRL